MENAVVHRIVEQQAVRHGDVPAIVGGTHTVTYRDLNYRANVVARHLMTAGFRRGAHASINLSTGADLATILLAVLKSGGSYSWVGPATTPGAEVSMALTPGDAPQTIDLRAVLAQPIRPCPNLPVLTRASDIACVLCENEGELPLSVPHGTIAALRSRIPFAPVWEGDRTTFDLWAGLMTGATLSFTTTPPIGRAA